MWGGSISTATEMKRNDYICIPLALRETNVTARNLSGEKWKPVARASTMHTAVGASTEANNSSSSCILAIHGKKREKGHAEICSSNHKAKVKADHIFSFVPGIDM